MSALARQQRPRASAAPSEERAAVVMLAVAVVSVAAPAWAGGKFGPEDGVDDLERIFHQRIAGFSDAVADQLEEARVDDFSDGKFGLRAGRAVVDDHALAFEALLGVGIGDIDGFDAHVV